MYGCFTDTFLIPRFRLEALETSLPAAGWRAGSRLVRGVPCLEVTEFTNELEPTGTRRYLAQLGLAFLVERRGTNYHGAEVFACGPGTEAKAPGTAERYHLRIEFAGAERRVACEDEEAALACEVAVRRVLGLVSTV